MTSIKRLFLITFAVATLLLAACDHHPREWKTPNMTALPPRLQPLFEKNKPVCFGRFMVDVPESATVVWGNTIVPLTVNFYPDGADEVNALAKKFIDELKNEKAINHDDVPLLLGVEDMPNSEGRIVIGYEDFQAINGLRINGYFRVNNDGAVVNSRPLNDDKDEAIALIKSIARRLRQRAENDVPTEHGNCIENAFLPDEAGPPKEQPGELIQIGIRLKEFPDTHLSIQTYPSNVHDPESASLARQWKRIREERPMTPEETKALAATTFFRENPRQIGDWKTGYEVLARFPDGEGVYSHHDFEVRFVGVPKDTFNPYASVELQTGVADNGAGAAKASLSDEEAIAMWDKITSTIRVRPTGSTPVKSAGFDPAPRLPLGELAATGRTCPQTGWWAPSDSPDSAGGQRKHFMAGERMPHVVTPGAPSLWQKLKGERTSYRTATVWKLMGYDDAPNASLAGVTANTGPGVSRQKKG
jgi:hypothetical protein